MTWAWLAARGLAASLATSTDGDSRPSVVDLQPKLNFAREVALGSHVAEATDARADVVTLQDRTVLVPALVEAEKRAVEKVQEVRPEFNIHPFGDVRPLEEGNVLVQIGEPPSSTVRTGSVTEGKLRRVFRRRVRPRIEVEHRARRACSSRVPRTVEYRGLLLGYARYDVGAIQDPVRPDVRVKGVVSCSNHLGSAALVLLDSGNTPASDHLARWAADVREFLAGAEGAIGTRRRAPGCWGNR